MTTHRLTVKDRRRFWSKVDRGPRWACWPWQAAIAGGGYGAFWLHGRQQAAHRVAYRIVFGSVDDDLTLDHLCRVRHCVNPSHLEPVTMRENLLRGESFSATNAAKTHCVNGHRLSSDNLYVKPSTGWRECRRCQRATERERRAREVVA